MSVAEAPDRKIADVFAAVRPDLSGFGAELKSQLKRSTSGVNAQVKLAGTFDAAQIRKSLTDTLKKSQVAAKLNGEFSAPQLQRALKETLAKAPLRAKIIAEFNSVEVVREVKETTERASRDNKVRLQAKLDADQFRVDLAKAAGNRRLEITAEMDAARTRAELAKLTGDQTVQVKAEMDVKAFRQQLVQLARDSANATNGRHELRFQARLDTAEFKAEVAKAAGNKTLEIKARLDALAARIEMAKLTGDKEVEAKLHLEAREARAELLEVTRKRKVELDVDKDKFKGLLGSLSGVSGLFSGLSGAASGFGSALSALGGAASSFTDVGKAMSSQVKGMSSALAAGEEGASSFGAALAEAVASGGITVALGVAAAAIAGFVAAATGAITVTVAFTAAAVVAGAVMAALASAAAVVAGAVAALPGVLFGAAGGFGVLAAAMLPVTDAMTAWIALQKANATQGNKLAKTQHDNAVAIADAKNSIISASESLRNAQDGEKRAQEDLIQARKDAIQNLEDMRRAVRDQADTEEAARIRVARAKIELLKVQDRPETDLERRDAVLALDEAQHQLADTLADGKKHHAAYAVALNKGVEGSKAVVDANRQVEQAHRGVADAQRGVAQAAGHLADVQSGQALAAASANTQLDAYSAALRQLSPAGQRFVHVLEGIVSNFQKLAQSPALTPLFDGLTSLTRAVSSLFGTTSKNGGLVLGPLGRGLASIGSAIGSVAAAFGGLFKNSAFVASLTTLLGAGAAAIKSIGGAAVPLLAGIVGGFADIAKVAQPVIHAISGGFKDMGPAIRTFFDALGKKDVIGGIAKGMGGFFKIVNGLLPILGKFVGELAKIGGPILDKLAGPLLTVFSTLGDLLVQFANGGLLDGFVVFVQAIGTALSELVKSGVMTQLSKSFGDVLKALGPQPGDKDGILVRLVKEIAPALPGLVKSFGDLAVEFLKLLPGLIPMIPPLVQMTEIMVRELIPHLPQLVDVLKLTAFVFGSVLTAIDVLLNPMQVIKGLVGDVKNAFATAAAGIKTAWNGFADYIKGPINTAIGYIDSFITAVNKISAFVLGKAAPQIPQIPKFGGGGGSGPNPSFDTIHHGRFAGGGILPGYSPGRDNMFGAFRGGLVGLSGGEGILRPEVSRVAPDMIHGLNAIARSSGTAGVRAALGYADGGIVGELGKLGAGAWTLAGNASRAAVNFLTDPGSAIGALAKHVLGNLAGLESTGFGRFAGSLPRFMAAQLAGSLGGVFGPAGGGASGLLSAAATQIGKPYVWDADSPSIGFDCSGLVEWAWQQVTGRDLPHSATAQFRLSTPVDVPAVGDLIFFGSGGYKHHVGIFAGGRTMLDAPHTGANVRMENIWSEDHVFGRLPPTAGVKLFDRGGMLLPGDIGTNQSGRPERVLNPAETAAYERGGGRSVVINQTNYVSDQSHLDALQRRTEFLARRL